MQDGQCGSVAASGCLPATPTLALKQSWVQSDLAAIKTRKGSRSAGDRAAASTTKLLARSAAEAKGRSMRRRRRTAAAAVAFEVGSVLAASLHEHERSSGGTSELKPATEPSLEQQDQHDVAAASKPAKAAAAAAAAAAKARTEISVRRAAISTTTMHLEKSKWVRRFLWLLVLGNDLASCVEETDIPSCARSNSDYGNPEMGSCTYASVIGLHAGSACITQITSNSWWPHDRATTKTVLYETSRECQEACAATVKCEFFVFYHAEGTCSHACWMKSAVPCEPAYVSNPDNIAGPATCDQGANSSVTSSSSTTTTSTTTTTTPSTSSIAITSTATATSSSTGTSTTAVPVTSTLTTTPLVSSTTMHVSTPATSTTAIESTSTATIGVGTGSLSSFPSTSSTTSTSKSTSTSTSSATTTTSTWIATTAASGSGTEDLETSMPTSEPATTTAALLTTTATTATTPLQTSSSSSFLAFSTTTAASTSGTSPALLHDANRDGATSPPPTTSTSQSAAYITTLATSSSLPPSSTTTTSFLASTAAAGQVPSDDGGQDGDSEGAFCLESPVVLGAFSTLQCAGSPVNASCEVMCSTGRSLFGEVLCRSWGWEVNAACHPTSASMDPDATGAVLRASLGLLSKGRRLRVLREGYVNWANEYLDHLVIALAQVLTIPASQLIVDPLDTWEEPDADLVLQIVVRLYHDDFPSEGGAEAAAKLRSFQDSLEGADAVLAVQSHLEEQATSLGSDLPFQVTKIQISSATFHARYPFPQPEWLVDTWGTCSSSCVGIVGEAHRSVECSLGHRSGCLAALAVPAPEATMDCEGDGHCEAASLFGCALVVLSIFLGCLTVAMGCTWRYCCCGLCCPQRKSTHFDDKKSKSEDLAPKSTAQREFECAMEEYESWHHGMLQSLGSQGECELPDIDVAASYKVIHQSNVPVGDEGEGPSPDLDADIAMSDSLESSQQPSRPKREVRPSGRVRIVWSVDVDSVMEQLSSSASPSPSASKASPPPSKKKSKKTLTSGMATAASAASATEEAAAGTATTGAAAAAAAAAASLANAEGESDDEIVLDLDEATTALQQEEGGEEEEQEDQEEDEWTEKSGACATGSRAGAGGSPTKKVTIANCKWKCTKTFEKDNSNRHKPGTGSFSVSVPDSPLRSPIGQPPATGTLLPCGPSSASIRSQPAEPPSPVKRRWSKQPDSDEDEEEEAAARRSAATSKSLMGRTKSLWRSSLRLTSHKSISTFSLVPTSTSFRSLTTKQHQGPQPQPTCTSSRSLTRQNQQHQHHQAQSEYGRSRSDSPRSPTSPVAATSAVGDKVKGWARGLIGDQSNAQRSPTRTRTSMGAENSAGQEFPAPPISDEVEFGIDGEGQVLRGAFHSSRRTRTVLGADRQTVTL